MRRKNLIPLNKRTRQERIAIARKGGLVKSERKALANSIKNIKTGIYATKFTKKIDELSKNPEKSAYQIFNIIERIGNDFDHLDVAIQIKIAKLLIDAHRVIHSNQQAALVQFNLQKQEKRYYEQEWLDEEKKKIDAHIKKILDN